MCNTKIRYTIPDVLNKPKTALAHVHDEGRKASRNMCRQSSQQNRVVRAIQNDEMTIIRTYY